MGDERVTPDQDAEQLVLGTQSGQCGWCGQTTWFALRTATWSGFESFVSGGLVEYTPLVAAIYQCGGCERPTLFLWTTLRGSGYGYTRSRLLGAWPERRAGEMKDLTDSVQGDRLEAWNCQLSGQHRAAILMARAALQRAVRILLARDDGALIEEDKGTLFSELDLLVSRGIITQQLRDNADEVRLSGNDIAHPEEMGEITEKDAQDSLIFLDDFLQTTLAVPTRQRKRKAAREGLEPPPEAE